MTKITIAILNHNGLNYLKRCLHHLLNQRYKDYEVLVVDNGSNDGSIQYLDSINDMKLIVKENNLNLGYSKGKNICVSESNGEYILLLDNDILIENNLYLQKILEKYKKLDDIAFFSSLMIDENSEKTKYYGIYYSWYGLNIHKEHINYKKIIGYSSNIKVAAYNGGAVFFKKSIWNKLGGYDEVQPFMIDDFDLGPRAYLFGYSNYLYKNAIIIHIGKSRDNNKKHFAWKYKYYFSGVAASMMKNFNTPNIFFRLPIFTFFSVFLMITIMIKKRNLYIPLSFISSYCRFIKTFSYIYKQRKALQKKITFYNDTYFKINPIKFDKND